MEDLDTLRGLRAELKAKVDAVLEATPEYRQMRALEAVIVKMESSGAPVPKALAAPTDYTVQGLALTFIKRAGEPQPISAIFDYVHGVKKFDDPKKARINVVSLLSKGKKLRSVQWNGSHAWWFANEPLPRQPKAATP